MNIPSKRELQQIALNHSSDMDFQDLMNLYKKRSIEPFTFLVIDTLLHQIIIYTLVRIF